MNRLADYFAMGGYAVYVWPAYVLTLVVLGGLVAHSWRRYRTSRRALRQFEDLRPPRGAGSRR